MNFDIALLLLKCITANGLKGPQGGKFGLAILLVPSTMSYSDCLTFEQHWESVTESNSVLESWKLAGGYKLFHDGDSTIH